MRMKRMVVGLLSLAVVGLTAQPSFAWLLSRCCGCKYTTYICCRPYNAFTPVCFGNITGLGCCPVALNCCQPSGPPSYPCGASCDSHCDVGASYGGYMNSTPMQSMPMQSMPAPGNFTPPPPTPMNGAVSYWWNQQQPYAMVPQYAPQYGVQQTGYYPPYNPGYYWPTAPAPMPNYWYGR
jgi:hypothetical protein